MDRAPAVQVRRDLESSNSYPFLNFLFIHPSLLRRKILEKDESQTPSNRAFLFFFTVCLCTQQMHQQVTIRDVVRTCRIA